MPSQEDIRRTCSEAFHQVVGEMFTRGISQSTILAVLSDTVIELASRGMDGQTNLDVLALTVKTAAEEYRRLHTEPPTPKTLLKLFKGKAVPLVHGQHVLWEHVESKPWHTQPSILYEIIVDAEKDREWECDHHVFAGRAIKEICIDTVRINCEVTTWALDEGAGFYPHASIT
jgi:hypothetical protein